MDRIDPPEMFRLTLAALVKRGRSPNLAILAGFIYGKYLSSYSYMDTPESLADCWDDCKVQGKANALLEIGTDGAQL